LAITPLVRHGIAMPTITRISYLTLEPRYLVDDALRPGTVEAATWIVPVCGWERRVWLLDGRPHRTDGPAIVDLDSPFQEWYQHGVLHREDGAARVTRTGDRQFFWRGAEFFWTLPEALWAHLDSRIELICPDPSTPGGVARRTEQQRRKALRLLSRRRSTVPIAILQPTIAQALAARDDELRRWGQALLPTLVRRRAEADRTGRVASG
jgi:hypothetical protein